HAVVEVASVLEPVGPGAALMVSREVDQTTGLRIAPEQGFKPQEGLLVKRASVHRPPPPPEQATEGSRAEVAVIGLLHRSREESGCDQGQLGLELGEPGMGAAEGRGLSILGFEPAVAGGRLGSKAEVRQAAVEPFVGQVEVSRRAPLPSLAECE